MHTIIRILILLIGILAITQIKPVHAESSCIAAAEPKAEIEAKHGRWILLTTDQWEFLRGVYVVNPNTPAGMPAGDRAILAQVEGDENGVVFFIDDGMACGAMKVPEKLIKMLLEIDALNITHDGAPM